MASAFGDFYDAGTVSTDSGSPDEPRVIVGAGTQWTQVAFAGDMFSAAGFTVPIGEIVDDTHLLLRYDWPGSPLLNDDYSIEFLSGLRHDPTQFSAELIDVKNRLRLYDAARPLFSVVAFGVNAPPAASVDDFYVIGTAPTGAWSGHNNEVARKTVTGWLFFTPEHGWAVIDVESNFVRTWDGSSWSVGVGLGATITYSGDWNDIDDFIPGNVVSHDDGAWVAINPNVNSEPGPGSTDWRIFLGVGEDGGAFALRYQFSISTADVEPATGILKFNNAPASATQLRLSRYDVFGNDWSVLLGTIQSASTSTNKGRVRIVTKRDGTRQYIGIVTAAAVGAGNYWNLTVTGPQLSSAALQDGAEVLFLFDAKGDKGDTGPIGVTGATGTPGGAFAVPFKIDANAVADSDPGNGVVRFSTTPQNAATVLRVDVLSTAGINISSLLSAMGTGTSTVKATGRIFATATPTTKWLTFLVTAVAALSGYYNLTIQVTGASADSPFAHDEAVTFDWARAGDKGDAGTIAVATTSTAAPGAPASVTNSGTVNAAVFNFAVPEGRRGQNFQPQYVVAALADRDDYDAGPVFDVNGIRLSVLVESDSSNGGLPTLYFLEGTGPAAWSDGITFGQASSEAVDITYDNGASGLEAEDVQAAIDEVVERVAAQSSAAAMALVLGG